MTRFVQDISSLARTSSVASTAFCLLSIGTGLYHVWHHRAKVRVDALEAVSARSFIIQYQEHVRGSHCIHESQAKYAYHVQGRTGKGYEDLSDPIIMSFFLAIPVGAMMWALLCFLLTVATYAIQCDDGDHTAIALLAAIFGLACLVSGATIVHSQRGRRADQAGGRM